MYEKFLAAFQRDRGAGPKSSWWGRSPEVPFRNIKVLSSFREELGGASFQGGLYRTVSNRNHTSFVDRVAQVFPDYRDRVFPLAFDWLNRIICADFDRTVQSKPLILILSHLDDNAIEIPVAVDDFHNNDLIEHRNELLEAAMFAEFLESQNMKQLPYSSCAGFSIPLFLGGEYSQENLEVNDVEVEWSITAQLLVQARSVDEGAVVSSVRIE